MRAQREATIEPWDQEGHSGRYIRTPHFDVYSTLPDRELENVLPLFLESAYEQYARTVPDQGREPARLTTYIFGQRGDWARFTRQHFGARYVVYRLIRAGGFTEGSTSVSFYTTRSGTLATLAHEGWHQYLNARCKDVIPPWINEGLACYHEAFDYSSDQPAFTPTQNTFRTNDLRDALHNNRLFSVEDIVRTDAGEVISQEHSTLTQTYYAQAWALVTFLRHGAGGRYRAGFDRMIRDIADGTFKATASAARLTAGAETVSDEGQAAFAYYIGTPPEKLADGYLDHIARIVGF
jgi:hypothetical protein